MGKCGHRLDTGAGPVFDEQLDAAQLPADRPVQYGFAGGCHEFAEPRGVRKRCHDNYQPAVRDADRSEPDAAFDTDTEVALRI